MSNLAGTATHTHQSREHDWQAAEELAAAFDRLAKNDPEIRINGTRADDRTMDLSLGAGRAHPESTRDFHSHAVDATRLFDPNGDGDPTDRWLSLVWENVPELITDDPLGGTIKDGASASAIGVGRLWRVAAARKIAEQQVRDAADRIRDLLSLLTWAFTLSLAGWRHSDSPAGEDVERLCPEGRAVQDWLLREIGARTGLSRADLDVARATRRGSAADELGQLHRDDPSYLGWLIDGVHERFPSAVEYLHLKTGTAERAEQPAGNRAASDSAPTGPTAERDDSALVMAMITGGGGMVMTDGQGREVAAGQIADRLAELNARLAPHLGSELMAKTEARLLRLSADAGRSEDGSQSRGADKPSPDRKATRRPNRTDADIARDEGIILGHLCEHPRASRDDVAKATGIAPAHVSESVAWKAHTERKKKARMANRARAVGGVGDPSVDRFGRDDDDD